MHRALRPGGDVLALEYLYNAGAPVDAVDEEGCTVLYVAAKAGYVDAVQWLLDRGADPAFAAFDGRSSLHAAAAAGHASTCEILLGALDRTSAARAMQAPDGAGRNPAQVAAAAQHMDVIRVLLGAHTRYELSKLRERESRDEAEGRLGRLTQKVEVMSRRNIEHEKLERIRGFVPLLHSPQRSVEAGSIFNQVKTP
mgnify:CR=1 FL=1